MARYSVLTTTEGPVAGTGGSLDFEIAIPSNAVDVYKVKITPSGGTGTTVFTIFKAAARAGTDTIYRTKAFTTNPYFDPTENNGGVFAERAEGFVCRYEDADAALKMYCTIVNNDAAPRSYDIAISIDESPFTPSTVGVPDLLTATASANGLLITTSVTAAVNNIDIDKADFRAMCVPLGDSLPLSEDLRIAAEGGTFVHNGTTQLVVTNLPANSGGATYKWTSTQQGRWYYAWRLHNAAGWSDWTDGNEDPSTVIQWVDTNSNTDTGPPSDWKVTIEQGPTPNTVIVHATRPKTNGIAISTFACQIKDIATGSWRTLDANAGAAETHYDGSGANHTLDPATGLFGNGGGGWSTAAVGDILLMDVRGNGSFTITHCLADIVKTITATTIELYTHILPLVTASMGGGVYNKIRLKIVKPMWNWNSEGYMGGWSPNGGYWDYQMANVQRFSFPDYTTTEFISDPIPIDPASTTVAARVWFKNGYSVSDGNIIVSSGIIGGNGMMGPYLWTAFNDRDWWVPTMQNGDNVSLTLVPGGQVTMAAILTGGAVRCPGISGVAARFRIFPDETGVVKVRIQFTVNLFSVPLPGNVAGSVGMILDMECNNPILYALNAGPEGFFAYNHGIAGPSNELVISHGRYLTPTSGLSGWASGFGAVGIKDTIVMPTSPFDIELRLTIDEATDIPGEICTVWKVYEYQINSGGWSTVPIPAAADTMYDRRVTLGGMKGYRPVLGWFQDYGVTGDNAMLTQFEVIQGIVARF